MDCSASEVDELIRNKMAEVKKLKDEHKVLLKSRSRTPKSGIEALNSELYSLMAEIEFLEESDPNIMPKCNDAVSAWAQQSLEEEIKQKEETLEKMNEECSRKKKLLSGSCSKSVPANVLRKMLEDARSKNEQLHCLHRKMARRLRRLSRRFPTLPEQKEKQNTSTRDETGNVLKRSFYRVLKEFVVELQDRTFKSDNWDEERRVYIDETFCKEHLEILCNTGIIQKSESRSPSPMIESD